MMESSDSMQGVVGRIAVIQDRCNWSRVNRDGTPHPLSGL